MGGLLLFLLVLAALALFLRVLFGMLTYSGKASADNNPKTYPYKPFFGNSTLTTIVDAGFSKTVLGLLFIFLFCALMFIFALVFLPDGPGVRGRLSWGNFILTACLFTYYLIIYDAQQSNKPSWTEWLT